MGTVWQLQLFVPLVQTLLAGTSMVPQDTVARRTCSLSSWDPGPGPGKA